MQGLSSFRVSFTFFSVYGIDSNMIGAEKIVRTLVGAYEMGINANITLSQLRGFGYLVDADGSSKLA